MNKNTLFVQTTVTKNDLKGLATKNDLKGLATKNDLAGLATKFATKAELKKTERVLRTEILRVEEKVEELQDGQKRVETTVNRMANQLDGFVGTVDDLRIDSQVGANQIHELRETVKDHETRITELESSN